MIAAQQQAELFMSRAVRTALLSLAADALDCHMRAASAGDAEMARQWRIHSATLCRLLREAEVWQ
jgi:hypothetical protein